MRLETNDPEILEARRYAKECGIDKMINDYLRQFDPPEREKRILAMLAWLEIEGFDANFLTTLGKEVADYAVS